MAPFHIGQKIVALRSSRSGYFRKGKVYRVKRLKQCGCGRWLVSIGAQLDKDVSMQVCDYCGSIGGTVEERLAYHYTKYFAPYNPPKVSIPASLMEQAEELVNVKETIAEPETETV